MHTNPIDIDFDGISRTQWDSWLTECRDQFYEAPRDFGIAVERMLLVNPPWITRLRFGDALARLVQNRTLRQLFRTGHIVWGHVIQANDELFTPAPSTDSYTYDRAGEIVFVPDAGEVVTPSILAAVAGGLVELRFASEVDTELEPWADYLNAETTRVVGWRVPGRLSPSADCFVSTTLFRRDHLPEGVLCRSLLPVVVAAQPPYFAMPLPRWYWPSTLLEWWSKNA